MVLLEWVMTMNCVWLDISVSNDGRFAIVGPEFLNASRPPCVKYAANGFWLLKKTASRWKIVFTGSEGPPCSLGVPRDLAGCMG